MVMRQLSFQLPPEVFTAAVARGRARQIDEVVSELVKDEPAHQVADDAAALI